jgi:ABC-type transport system substrate-binding protein
MNKQRKSGSASLVLCVLATVLLVAGCRREGDDTKPVASKQLTIAIGEAPNTADPVAALDVGSAHLLNAIHAPLSVVDQDGKLVMVLAESITMAADGLSCEIELKPAKFWDDEASPVTAADVRYSFERVRASAHPHKWILDRLVSVEAFDKKEAEHVAGIEVRGERGLTFRFSRPEPDFPLLISSGLTAVIKTGSDKLPKQPFDRHIVGAGPWRPMRFNPGVAFELTANAGFPRLGNAGSLTFVVEANPQNQLEGVAKGRFDGIRLRGPMIAEASELKDGSRLQPKPHFKDTRLLQARANELTFLKWNWAHAQLADMPEEQRKSLLSAVSARVSRAALAKTLYLGAGEVAYSVAPPSTLPIVPPPAGSAGDFKSVAKRTLTMVLANDPSSRQLGAYVQSELREFGLEMELNFVDLPNLVQRIIKGDYAVSLLWVEQQIPSTGCFAWTMFFTPGAPFTLFGQPIDGLSESALAARGVLDLEARRLAYAKVAEEIGQKQTAWTPLLSRSVVMMVGPRCEGLFLDANGFPYFLFLRAKE